MCNKSTQIVVYTDDTVNVGRSTDALKGTAGKLMTAERVMGLTINTQKTKHMRLTETTK